MMLVHSFRCGDLCYVYDVGVNAVLEIDAVVHEVLPLYGKRDNETIVRELKDTHGRRAVVDALAEIESASREQGLFRPLETQIATGGDGHLCWEDYDTRLRHLTLSITEGCNLRCRYCLHDSAKPWVRPHGFRAMSTDVAMEALAYFAEHSHETESPVVTFYGGEPLLEFGLIERLVSEAAQRPDWPQLQFIVATNATLFDEEMIDFVLEHEVRLQISLDGPARLHDSHRCLADGRPTHHLVEEAITALLRKNPDYAAKLSFIATLAPPYDLAAVATYFREFEPYLRAGIGSRPLVTLNVVDLEGIELDEPHDPAGCDRALDEACNRYVTACVAGTRDELSPAVTSFFDPGLIKFYHRSLDPVPPQFPPTGTCQPGQRKLHVRVDGTYQPCERVGESLPIGHVSEGIDRRAVADLHARLCGTLAPRCVDCWALRLCNLCFTALAPMDVATGGRSDGIPESFCERARARAESILKLYATLLAGDPQALAFLADSTVE